MITTINNKLFYWFLASSLLFAFPSFAQTTLIKGTVLDAATLEPIPFASVYIPNSTSGSTTDEFGFFEFSTTEKTRIVEASFIGFRTASINIELGTTNQLQIKLENDANTLEEVVVKSGKMRYRNKNNPAVDLVKKIIEHKEYNKTSASDYLSFEEYEKIQFSLSNKPEKLRKSFIIRKFPFLISSLDTTKLEGKAILPLYMAEVVSQNYLGFRPERKNKVILADKKVSFDKDFFDDEGIGTYLKYIYQPIDVYENNITIVSHEFMSPIADLAPTFYKFYISDTIEVEGKKLIDLFFTPRNPADFLFTGNMLVTLDGNYAIQNINIKLHKNINLNWVRNLRIIQNFTENDKGRYHLSRSKLSIEFGITKRGDGGLYGERSVSLRNYNEDEKIPDSLFTKSSTKYLNASQQEKDSILAANRQDKINYSEQMVYANMDSLQGFKSIKRILNIATTVLAGYTKVSEDFEIGPVNTFYGYNPVEGLRLRAGGRTTLNFNKHLYFEGYGAYGFKDQKWKYFIGSTYSFSGKDRFDFPAKSISVSYQKDTKIPGQELEFIQEDNVLLSFKRGENNKWLYNKIFNIEYLQEFSNDFSYKLGFKNWEQSPAGGLHFISDATGKDLPSLTTTEFLLEVRWAPNQKFYQGKSYRIPFPNRYPILTLRSSLGVKDILKSQFDYVRMNLNVFKRVYLGQLGFTDVIFDAGYIFGQVPYPLLHIPRANQTYAYQMQSYNLMNFLEFVSDQYVSIQLDQNFNGFIFNKIPLIKRLKLREFVTFKAIYGGLSAENMPGNSNPKLLNFPTNSKGIPTTYTFDYHVPYIEGSIGIGNIFKFFRLDLVKRFTYLDHPSVTPLGIRGRFKFDF